MSVEVQALRLQVPLYAMHWMRTLVRAYSVYLAPAYPHERRCGHLRAREQAEEQGRVWKEREATLLEDRRIRASELLALRSRHAAQVIPRVSSGGTRADLWGTPGRFVPRGTPRR